MESDGRKEFFGSFPQEYAHEFVGDLGLFFAYMKIPVEELPAIALDDGYFLNSYIQLINGNPYYLEMEDRTINPDYDYKKITDFIYRLQSELDLRKAREEQNNLNGRAQGILEAETLVEQQQGQQQE